MESCPLLAMKQGYPQCPSFKYNIDKLLEIYYAYKRQTKQKGERNEGR